MDLFDTAVRPPDCQLVAHAGSSSVKRKSFVTWRLVAFVMLHLALLGALYGLAYLNAKGHELESDAYGADRVEHLGRMSLYPLVDPKGVP